MNTFKTFKGTPFMKNIREASEIVDPILTLASAASFLYSVATYKKKEEEAREEMRKMIKMEVASYTADMIEEAVKRQTASDICAAVDTRFNADVNDLVNKTVEIEVAKQLQFLIDANVNRK